MKRGADILGTFSLDSAMAAAQLSSKPCSRLGAALRGPQWDHHLYRGGIGVTVPLSAVSPGMKFGAGDLAEHPRPRTQPGQAVSLLRFSQPTASSIHGSSRAR